MVVRERVKNRTRKTKRAIPKKNERQRKKRKTHLQNRRSLQENGGVATRTRKKRKISRTKPQKTTKTYLRQINLQK